jgi:hypothetical protein
VRSSLAPGAGLAGLFLACGLGCGAGPTAELAPCQPREESCREQVFLAVEQMRGDAWDPWARPPPARTITVEQYLASIVEPDVDVPILIPAAYFDAGDGVVVIVEDAGRSDLLATVDLVHAQVNAAQARELGAYVGPTTDWAMVRGALTEGEAVLYATIAELRMTGADPRQYDWDARFHDELASIRQLAPSAPSSSRSVRQWLQAPLGGALAARAWLRDGHVGVNELFLHPARSFIDLMLGFEGRPAADAQLPRCGLAATLQARLTTADSLGAGDLYTYLASISGLEQESWDAALRWRGDDYLVLAGGLGEAAAFWTVTVPGLADGPLGEQLAARRLPPVLSGDYLVYWHADNPALAEAVRAAITCTLPPPP